MAAQINKPMAVAIGVMMIRTEQAAESTAEPVARSQGDQQTDNPSKQAADDGADNCEEKGFRKSPCRRIL